MGLVLVLRGRGALWPTSRSDSAPKGASRGGPDPPDRLGEPLLLPAAATWHSQRPWAMGQRSEWSGVVSKQRGPGFCVISQQK